MSLVLLICVWALFGNEVLELKRALGIRKTRKLYEQFFRSMNEKNQELRVKEPEYAKAQEEREAPELAEGAHAHDAPVKLKTVTLLRAEGPYLTVREEGLLDEQKVARVMTIYDGKGKMARVFIEEAKRTGRKMPEGIALELLDPV